jgi:hypothetical protein
MRKRARGGCRLRWINAGAAESIQTLNMVRFDKHLLDSSAAPQQRPDTVGNMMATVQVVAAWPAGISHLAQAVDACQRRDMANLRSDWLGRAIGVNPLPPTFWANAPESTPTKRS